MEFFSKNGYIRASKNNTNQASFTYLIGQSGSYSPTESIPIPLFCIEGVDDFDFTFDVDQNGTLYEARVTKTGMTHFIKYKVSSQRMSEVRLRMYKNTGGNRRYLCITNVVNQGAGYTYTKFTMTPRNLGDNVRITDMWNKNNVEPAFNITDASMNISIDENWTSNNFMANMDEYIWGNGGSGGDGVPTTDTPMQIYATDSNGNQVTLTYQA
jgi:hypothetical protein